MDNGEIIRGLRYCQWDNGGSIMDNAEDIGESIGNTGRVFGQLKIE